MKIVTFNLRCALTGDGINSFYHRAGGILREIDSNAPDIIAFQEVMPEMLEFLKRHLPDYTFVGHGRCEQYDGEGLYTAFRRELTLIGYDTFWLSETPELPASRFKEQSGCPRICVCTSFRQDGKTIHVYNNHLDHISDSARILGIGLILERVRQKLKDGADDTVYILGDFNALPDSETIARCERETAVKLVDLTKALPVSFHKYGSRAIKIDYIFTNAANVGNIISCRIWDSESDGIYLSDHYPIEVETK